MLAIGRENQCIFKPYGPLAVCPTNLQNSFRYYGRECSSDAIVTVRSENDTSPRYKDFVERAKVGANHMETFFNIKIVQFDEIKDDFGKSFVRYMGQSLLEYDDVNKGILIPFKSNYKEHFKIERLPLETQFVLKMIYADSIDVENLNRDGAELNDFQTLFKQLCADNYTHKRYILDLYGRTRDLINETRTNTLAGLCSQPDEIFVTFSGPQQAILDEQPPFIKNLVQNVVFPDTLTLRPTSKILRFQPTCSIERDGLKVKDLYNPDALIEERPLFTENDFIVKQAMRFLEPENAYTTRAYPKLRIQIGLFNGNASLGRE